MAIKVRTYSDLNYFLKLFKKTKPSLMIIQSRGGLGKSHAVEKLLKGQAEFIRGHCTALSMYRLISEHPEDELQLVIDDVNIFRGSVMIGIVKQMADTKKKQVMSYNSTHSVAEMLKSETVKKMSTLVLLNQTNLKSNPDTQAIGDRGHCIHFCPSNEEVMGYALDNNIGNDKEILEFLAKYYMMARNFSLRTIIKAKHHKAMSNDWRLRTLNEMEVSPKYSILIDLIHKYPTDKERIRHYRHSRADYYRVKKKVSQSLKEKKI